MRYVSVVTLVLGVSALVWANAPQPELKTISPNRGWVGGGTLVEIRGENFDLLPAGTLDVYFGYDKSPSVQYVSPTLVRAVSPPHKFGNVYVKFAVNDDLLQRFGRRSFNYVNERDPSTTTTTTTPVSTTTTTVPCGDCNDADPCTIDGCVNGQCTHQTVGTSTEVLAQVSACSGANVPAVIGSRFVQACNRIERGRAATTPAAARRHFRAAVRLYTKTLKGVQRAGRRGFLSFVCADPLATFVDGARGRAKALRDG